MPQGFAITKPKTLAQLVEEARTGKPTPTTPTIRPEMSWWGWLAQQVDKVMPQDPVGILTAPMGPGAPVKQRAASTLGELAQEARQPITAYHGSPHDFDKFSLEKIGTGEGAQAYGHGLYFAENPSVAKGYKEALSGGVEVAPGKVIPLGMKSDMFSPEAHAGSLLAANGMDLDRAIAATEIRAAKEVERRKTGLSRGLQEPEALELLKQWKASGHIPKEAATGKTYEVAINAHPDDFLDWDKPLSQQSEKVRKVLGMEDAPALENRLNELIKLKDAKAADRLPNNIMRDEKGWHALANEADQVQAKLERMKSGQAVYENLRRQTGGMESATEELKKLGIKGVRYLDQGSRGPTMKYEVAGETFWSRANAEHQVERLRAQGKNAAIKELPSAPQTSNYVVFDDSIIDIRKKMVALLGLGSAVEAARQQLPQRKQQ